MRAPIVTMLEMMRIKSITPEIIAPVSGPLEVELLHFPSLRDEVATEHSEATVVSTPVIMILAPLLTHSSIREMSEPLSVSEVPSSLAQYVTYVGDSGKQKNGM